MQPAVLIVLLTALVAGMAVPAQAEEYQLDIARETVNITGTSQQKITVNGSIPGPTLQFTEGREAIIHVTNHMNEPTSVHWHGILLPGEMDGVEHFNGYRSIAPGQTFTYRFLVRQSGTYWYHAHTGGQEQDGLYGALIFKPAHSDPVVSDRDDVVILSDYTPEDSHEVLAHLKMTSDYYSRARRTIGDFFAEVKRTGFIAAWKDAVMWGGMRMSKTDLSDVSGYTFLVNGKPPQHPAQMMFKPGERVRLRMINASAMTFYDVRIVDENGKSIKLSVVQADGQPVEPVSVNEFRFGVAETYDAIVTPKDNQVYTLVAEPIDRSGFALATLVPEDRAAQSTEPLVPAHRARAELTMADMGMEMDMGSMDHSAMSEAQMQEMMEQMSSGWARAGTPRSDRALSYMDLRYAGEQKDQREPDREIVVKLGGNMQRYLWTLNGKKYEDSEPIRLTLGERVRLTFVNETMMAHPMHLHGMFVQLDNGQPLGKLPNKHTVIVAPGQSYSVLLTADEPGEWAFHCHLLYHMATGMMNKVVVAKLDAPAGGVHAH